MQLLSFKNLENMKMTLPAGISFKFFPHNNLLKYFKLCHVSYFKGNIGQWKFIGAFCQIRICGKKVRIGKLFFIVLVVT